MNSNQPSDQLKQEKLDALYMDIANRISHMSYSQRKKVGAIAVRDGNIISFGWNGTPAGFDNCCELSCDHDDPALMQTDPVVMHAESNLLLKLATSTQHSVGATLYQTLSPCFECAKLIIQAKIIKVVYKEQYRNTDGIELLKKAKIEIIQLKDIANASA